MSSDRITVAKLAALRPGQLASILAGPADHAAAWIAAAAQNGIVEAQAVYGHLLLAGKGVSADPVAALTWFKHAAQADHPLAMNMVGRCYELGWGTACCFEVAVYWYRLAARAGSDWGMYNYATALALGQGIGVDRAEALRWFERAAALGHAKSHNYIGSFYEDGWVDDGDGVVKAKDASNFTQARHHYRLAAEGGDFRGQFNYARLLAEADNLEEALLWIGKMQESATPAFLDKVRAMLTVSAHPVHRRLLQRIRHSSDGSAVFSPLDTHPLDVGTERQA